LSFIPYKNNNTVKIGQNQSKTIKKPPFRHNPLIFAQPSPKQAINAAEEKQYKDYDLPRCP
jgi:hypothetical protein